jgi:hypothetical protein
MSSASSLRFAPVRWSATPPGAAWAVQWAARSGAPVPAPARQAARALRSRSASRARPGQTGGDPAAPGRLPATPQPPHEPRPSLRFGPRRRVGAPAPLRSGLRLRALRALRPGPQGPALAETARSPGCARRNFCARSSPSVSNAYADGEGSALRSFRLRFEPSPTAAAWALLCPRPGNSVRFAHCASLSLLTAYASRRRLRSFVAPTDDASRPASASLRPRCARLTRARTTAALARGLKRPCGVGRRRPQRRAECAFAGREAGR